MTIRLRGRRFLRMDTVPCTTDSGERVRHVPRIVLDGATIYLHVAELPGDYAVCASVDATPETEPVLTRSNLRAILAGLDLYLHEAHDTESDDICAYSKREVTAAERAKAKVLEMLKR